MSKRFLSLILSVMLVLCLVACHSETMPENSEDANVVSEDDSFPGTGEMTSSGSSSAVLDESELEIKTNSQADSSLDTPKTEVKTNSQLNSSTEIVLSSPNSSEITSSGEFCDVPPDDDFYSNSVQELIEWVKNNKKTSLYTQTTNQPFLSSVKQSGTLIIPKPVKEDLTLDSIYVVKDSDSCTYYFQTCESDIQYENQLYGIVVRPISNQNTELINLVEVTPYKKSAMKTGKYQNYNYIYLDGYEGTNNSDRIFATAWFIKDDCLISITASWSNSFKPWSTDYFDYFDFETITL